MHTRQSREHTREQSVREALDCIYDNRPPQIRRMEDAIAEQADHQLTWIHSSFTAHADSIHMRTHSITACALSYGYLMGLVTDHSLTAK